MRILFILTQDLESPSGLGRYWPLACELAKRGHQVRVVALHANWDGLSVRHFENNGVQIDYVAPMHVQKIGNQKRYYSTGKFFCVILRATWALCRAALSGPADIIQVGKPHPMNGLAGLLARWIKGGTLCVDCDDYEAQINNFSSEWQRKIVAYFERTLPRKARLVTTHTQFMHDKLVAWGCPEERIHYLSNGVDRRRFLQPDADYISTLRQKLDLEGKRVVAYLGSLSQPGHPVNLLLNAFALVYSRIPEAVLLLIGGGEDLDALALLSRELGIEQVVHIIGRVHPSEVPRYYSLAEVTVDPVYDNDAARGRSPLKMFESWAMEIPFVTADVGERSRLAGNPPACILISSASDVRMLADAIYQLLTSTELSNVFRQRGLERVKDFTWECLAANLEQIYQGVL